MKSIHVSIRDQQLTVKENEQPIRTYPVSTSRFGIGTEEGSFKTPTGRFRVAEKIGSDMPNGTVFVGRVPLQPDEALPPTEDLDHVAYFVAGRVGRAECEYARPLRLHSWHQTRGQSRHGCESRLRKDA